MQNIWEYKDPQYPSYPTEKNLELLKNIVKTSSSPDDLVLDCFCGSGTTLQAAQELGRNWIGIDQSEKAIKATKERLLRMPKNLFSYNVDYEFLVQQELLKNYTERDVDIKPETLYEGMETKEKVLSPMAS